MMGRSYPSNNQTIDHSLQNIRPSSPQPARNASVLPLPVRDVPGEAPDLEAGLTPGNPGPGAREPLIIIEQTGDPLVQVRRLRTLQRVDKVLTHGCLSHPPEHPQHGGTLKHREQLPTTNEPGSHPVREHFLDGLIAPHP